MEEASVKLQISTLPHAPGVYQYYDKERKFALCGQGQGFEKRVTSYFTKQHDNARTRLLVKKSVRLNTLWWLRNRCAVVGKQPHQKYQPRYNVMLKDDKSYPWLCIKTNAFQGFFHQEID